MLTIIRTARRPQPWPDRAVETLARWTARARQRRGLRELPDALLRDLGLSREQAETEAAKPFWRP